MLSVVDLFALEKIVGLIVGCHGRQHVCFARCGFRLVAALVLSCRPIHSVIASSFMPLGMHVRVAGSDDVLRCYMHDSDGGCRVQHV